MNANKRPLSIWILSCLFIAVGAGGFAIHFRELLAPQQGAIWIEVTDFWPSSPESSCSSPKTGRAGSLSSGWPFT
jgi:hypothetical protein